MRCSSCDRILRESEEYVDKKTGDLNTLCSKCMSYSYMDDGRNFYLHKIEADLGHQSTIYKENLDLLETMADELLKEGGGKDYE